MSYSGEIQAAGIMAVAAYAARAVSKAAMAGVNAVRSAKQTAAVHRMESRLSSLTQNASDVCAALGSELDGAAAQGYADYAQTLAKLEQLCETSKDTAAFFRDCERARETLYRSISEKRSVLETGAVASVREAMRSGQALLQRERRETDSSMQRITDDLERRAVAGEYARQVMQETAAMAEDVRSNFGSSLTGAQAVDACTSALQQVQSLLDGGLSEAALTTAYAAQDALLQRVTELMTAECRNRQLYTDVQAALETAGALLREREICYHFEQTRTGQPAEKQITELPRYFRGAWESLEQELSALAAQFSAQSMYDHDTLVLEDLLDRVNDWRIRFSAEQILAYERLHNELLRMETGRLLVQHYLSQGYRLLPLTAEEKAVSPLDSLLIRLEHPQTGAQTELRLNAVPDADGHVTMRIFTEDHTAYPGSDSEIEAARAAAREEACDTIRHSGIGKGMQLRQRCRNPGVRDTFQKS